MEFGKLSPAELEHTDFTLLPDPPETTDVLKHAGKKKTKFYAGCAKWGRKDWIGKFYPKGTKEKDFLEYYAKWFNSIEFNGFYYNLHPRQQVEKWKEKVPQDFLFCPKFTQSVTHYKRLKNTEADIDAFLNSIEGFGNSLGPVFLMPHPGMGPKELDTIEHFLKGLPEDLSVFLELRHPDFYVDGYNKELFQFLKTQHRGTVITDAAGRRDCAHMYLTTPECFIRFVGNSLHKSDYTRIDDWVNRIAQWAEQGLEKCYFFMHQHDELHSPELIKYFIEQLNKHVDTGLTIPEPPSANLLF